MKVLIVEVNFDYKNPMYRQFYTSMLSCMETDYFGPGYVSRECLEKGIRAYLEERDAYDAILLGNFFVYSAEIEGARHNAYHVHRHTLPYYNVNDAYQCCGKIYEELLQIKDIIKIFVYYEDIWSMPIGDEKICHELLDCGFYILSWPLEYMAKYSVRQTKRILTNYGYNLASTCEQQYIPIPLHGVGYHEIFVRNFSERKYDWCIPGNKVETYYPERKQASELIQQRQKRVWDEDPYQMLSVETIRREHMEWYKFRNNFERYLSWVWKKNNNIASQPKMQYIAACREQYLESMRSSKFVYAEGGIMNNFVRKYFEACACGAVLVAKKVPGMYEMGFVHEKNCIIVKRYKDIIDIDTLYSERQQEQIAKSGQELILKKHMFVHRANALHRTIEVILHGTYKGAYWEDGNYRIKESDKIKFDGIEEGGVFYK